MTASAALVAALVTGCSAGSAAPKAAAFAPGTCRDAAPALLGLHSTARYVLASKHPNLAAANRAVTRDQRTLRDVRADAGLADPIEKVVVAAGFFRIRIDSKTFDKSLARSLDAAYTEVERRCVSADR